MAKYDGATVLKKVRELTSRSRRVETNVTVYTGPELGRLAEGVGQRNVFGGYNWDTRVRNRSAKYTVVLGSKKTATRNPSPEQADTLSGMDRQFTRTFGGEHDGKKYPGHANQTPIDLVHRVMGSGEDQDFTFNCYLMVTTKNRANHHISYMWGKMGRVVDPVKGAEDLYMLMVPDIYTGDFGRFYCFPEQNVTIGLGSDYMGEAKKGMLRMAMHQAKGKGILGVHAGTKIVRAFSRSKEALQRYGVAVFGNSGTGKTTNIGHTHYLNKEGEQALVVQDDFAGLRLKDGRILGTERAMFLKTDLDEDDVLLRPATESPEFVSQNVYIDHRGEIQYLEEDLCANGRGILPLRALPKERRYESIDVPPLEELDGLFILINTRANTVVPILQELTPEQCAAYFVLGESIETAAGDPTKAGQSTRVVGMNAFIVGDPAEEGNLFYEYLKRYENKVRCVLMNSGGVGEIRDPENPTIPMRPANRPWKTGIGYVSRALFRNTATWSDCPDFGTKVLTAGVRDEHGKIFDMGRFDPRQLYDPATREEMVRKLNRERVHHLERFPNLDPKIKEAVIQTHLL
jgi:phosphoenolpyruvate carboxykinase (ATP)